jgi:hypothetical protein
VKYFHLVFTLGEEFRQIALYNKKTVYGILFRAAADTLLKIARDPKRLGADIGFFGILHTWGQNLAYHAHAHFVIAGGGPSLDKSCWISVRRDYFLPRKVLQIVFRAKFLEYIERAFKNGKLSFPPALRNLAEPKNFKALLVKASKRKWYVSARRTFGSPKIVLKYLARYTNRVAISNQRLVSMNGREVTFRWKDYKDQGRKKLMTLDVFEFIRRFLLHVFPPGFRRIRYYGFLSPRKRQENLDLCRRLLGFPSFVEDHPPQNLSAREDTPERPDKPRRCPACEEGFIWVMEVLPRATAISQGFSPPVELLNTS